VRSLTLVHRRDAFKAAPASVNKMKELVMLRVRSTSSSARLASSTAKTGRSTMSI
jgi:thioredoxin reductase